MGIDLEISNKMILSIEGSEDIELFLSIFSTLKECKQKSGYVKTANITEKQWEVIEGIGEFFKE